MFIQAVKIQNACHEMRNSTGISFVYVLWLYVVSRSCVIIETASGMDL